MYRQPLVHCPSVVPSRRSHTPLPLVQIHVLQSLHFLAKVAQCHFCALPEDRDFGGSRGFGFVVMDAADVVTALTELDGLELDGRVIRVTEAGGRRGGRNDDVEESSESQE
jgi:RNA recognition motif-containing protein